jgi:ribosomal protein L37AE/L43A
MIDSKDRFGDLLAKKEKGDEDRYAAEQDRLKLAKLREQTEAEGAARGRCPSCGATLNSDTREGLTIAICGKCRGCWIDATALETMVARAGESEITRWLRSFLGY